MLMVHPGSSAVGDYNSWMVFGDPTLMMRTKTPQAMTVTHNPVIFFGMGEFSVTCDAEGALVTMSYVDTDNEVVILGSAVVSGGIANISLTPVTMPTTITLAIVGHNKVTHISEVLATPASGPYVVPSGYTVTGSEKLTFTSTNEEIVVTLNNVGVEATDALTVTVICDDPQITFINNTTTCEGIAPDGSITVKFSVTIANDISDGKGFLVDVNVTEDGKSRSWDGKLPLKAYAPVFSLEQVLIDGEENGSLGKGTVATITTVVKNKGGADAYAVKNDIEIDSEYITLACEDISNPAQNLPAGESIELPFIVITSPDMPYGHIANIDLLLNAKYDRTATENFTAACSGSDNYCSSGNQNCNGPSDKFTSVILYKTSAPSVLLINNQDETCSTGGYQDFTNTVVELEAGAQYTIKVKCGYSSQYVGGWFDLNGNNVFDGSEKLITLVCSSSGTEYTQNFTIPTDFTPGASRFRLVCNWNSAPTNACGNSSYGQTHDYTIVLPEIYSRVQNVEAVLDELENVITITWEKPEEGTPDGYNIYRYGNKLNDELLTETTFTEKDIITGIYAYNVTAVYGTKESYSEMSNVICNIVIPPAPCEMPTNLEGTADKNTAIITWEEPENIEGELFGYNIYRNGDETPLNEELLEELEYRDEELVAGTYSYQVSAVYEHCGESDLTDEVIVKILACEMPTGLGGIDDEHTAILNWYEPENIEGVLLGYNIYRDGDETPLNEEPLEELEYRDEDLPNETYIYQVSAVYEHCESELTEGILVRIDVTGVCNVTSTRFS
jgi:hypothetical protein